MSILSYLRARIQNPGVRDFADMGIGIEARYLRCKPYWKRHLALSKEFQEHHLAGVPAGGDVAILGAGRLFDVDLPFLLRTFERIELYDADPTALPVWQREAARLADSGRILSRHEDLTGSLTAWTDEVRNFLKPGRGKLDELVALLHALRADPPKVSGRAIVSLNLLSQLGIYWRDRVSSMLSTYWKLQSNEQGEFEQPLQEAIEGSMRELEAGHLHQLAVSGASRIVMLYDDLFMYYLRDHSLWQCEEALRVPPELALPGYELDGEDSWFWHIAPQGVEQAEYGALHRVQARAFRKLVKCTQERRTDG